MAYRFNGTSDYVEFASSPLSGVNLGPFTMAILLNRSAVSSTRTWAALLDSTLATSRIRWGFHSSNVIQTIASAGSGAGTQVLNSTSLWYLIVVTCPAGAGSVTPRNHVHDGTSWNHENGSTITRSSISGTDRLIVGKHFGVSFYQGDIVCIGIKKADTPSDATVETLSRTTFDAWRSFGFDWLIGFDSSLEAGGILQDQASPGTGDEIAISGTTQVSDPSGWVWASATRVSSTRTLKYDVIARVASTRTLGYSVTSRVAKTLTVTWGLGTARVSATRSLRWQLISKTAGTRTVRWQILEAPFRISATQTLAWVIVDYDPPPEVEPDGRFMLALDGPALEVNPVWTRIDDSYPNLVTSYTIDRGRQYELDRTDTGRATVQIIDTDGILDPRNPAGPFYGKIQPLVQARLGRRNPVTDEWKTRYRGWIEDLNYVYDPTRRFNRLEISLVDMFEILSAVEMQPARFGTGTGIDGQVAFGVSQMDDRIIYTLNQAGIPKPFRVIFSGNVVVQPVTYSAGESPMTVIQDAADAEFPGVANVYCDRKGRLCVHGRLAKFFPDLVAAGASVGAWDFQRWKAGDNIGIGYYPDATAQLRSFAYNRGLSKVINQANATPQGIADNQVAGQLVEDTASIGKYGIRSWSATNLLTQMSLIDGSNANTETRRFATYYVQNYAEPRDRVAEISFRSLRPDDPRAAATWKLMSEIDISDAVAVSVSNTWSEPGVDGFVLEDYFVEGIHEHVEPLDGDIDDVTLTLDLSPAAYFAANPWPGDTEELAT